MTPGSSAPSRSTSLASTCRGGASSAAPARAGLALGGLSALLAACGGVEGTADEDDGESEQKAAAVSHPKTAIGNWTFSNWPLYIDKKVIKDFDKEFGGKLQATPRTINDNDEFFGKVRQQLEQGTPIGRDIVALDRLDGRALVRLGYVEPIDKDNIPNADEPASTPASRSTATPSARTRCRGSRA